MFSIGVECGATDRLISSNFLNHEEIQDLIDWLVAYMMHEFHSRRR